MPRSRGRALQLNFSVSSSLLNVFVKNVSLDIGKCFLSCGRMSAKPHKIRTLRQLTLLQSCELPHRIGHRLVDAALDMVRHRDCHGAILLFLLNLSNLIAQFGDWRPILHAQCLNLRFKLRLDFINPPLLPASRFDQRFLLFLERINLGAELLRVIDRLCW